MKVAIVLGSKSDMMVAEKCKAVLDEFSIEYTLRIASAHRTPETVIEIARMNYDVYIAIAGLSAALPGVIAAHTVSPVIGVPVSGKLNLDSILSMVQMPGGVPVATVGLDRGDNAALLALSILSLKDEKVRKQIIDYRKKMNLKVKEDDNEINR